MPYLLVRVDPETFQALAIRDVRQALERHPGQTPVIVAVRGRRLRLHERFHVDPVPELLMELLRAGVTAEPAPDPWWNR
jgi:hypothetical protein